MKIKKFNNYTLLKENSSAIEEIKDMINDVKYAFIDFANDNNLIIKLKHFDKVNYDSKEVIYDDIDSYIKDINDMYMRSGENLYENYCLDVYINIIDGKKYSTTTILKREHLEIITNDIMLGVYRLDDKYKVDVNLNNFYDLNGYDINIVVKKK